MLPTFACDADDSAALFINDNVDVDVDVIVDVAASVIEGEDSFATAAVAALEIDDSNPPARRNTLGDSGPFWAFLEPDDSPRSCPDPSASIASCNVWIGGGFASIELLFGRHGGSDGVLRSVMDWFLSMVRGKVRLIF